MYRHLPWTDTFDWWDQHCWSIMLTSGILTAILFWLHLRRVRELTHRSTVRLEERAAERARAARESCDTLLQSFQGLLFHMQAVREVLPQQPVQAVHMLDTALLQGEAAIEQARKAIGDAHA